MRKRKRLRFGHFLSWITVASLLLCGALAWVGFRFLEKEFPDVSRLKTHFPAVKYQGRGQPFVIDLQKSRPRGWTSLSEIPRSVSGAIIVSEDWAFYQHKGYDAAQIKEAIKKDIEKGEFARGASTITQQVVKNVFLSRDKTLWRKAKELLLAVRLEEAVGKHRILESYLNIAEWGEGVFGIRAAAWTYFGKSPGELSPKEAAFLAMLLPSPKRYSQSFRARKLTQYARKTVSQILSKMAQAQFISIEQRDEQLMIPLSFEEGSTEPMAPVDPDTYVEPELGGEEMKSAQEILQQLSDADSAESEPMSERLSEDGSDVEPSGQ